MCGVKKILLILLDFHPNFGRTRVTSLHAVVVELYVDWQPRCRTGNGCDHVSNLSSISGRHFRPFIYHIYSLGTNYLCGLNLIDVVFVQLA